MNEAVQRSLRIVMILVALVAIGLVLYFTQVTPEDESGTPSPTPTPEQPADTVGGIPLDEPLTYEQLQALGVIPPNAPRDVVREGLTVRELLAMGVLVQENGGEPHARGGLSVDALFDLGILRPPQDEPSAVQPTPPAAAPVSAPSGPMTWVVMAAAAAVLVGGALVFRLYRTGY